MVCFCSEYESKAQSPTDIEGIVEKFGRKEYAVEGHFVLGREKEEEDEEEEDLDDNDPIFGSKKQPALA